MSDTQPIHMPTILRALVDLRDQNLQKSRIQWGNRLNALDRTVDNALTTEHREIAEFWYADLQEKEKMVDRQIAKVVRRYPIYHDMVQVKGLGPMFSAKLLAFVDIYRCPHVSSLWKYAGYSVEDGAADRRRRGEKMTYNARLKTTCFLIGDSFIKTRSPYRDIYDQWKSTYLHRRDVSADYAKWSDLRIHRAASRKMVKRFLAHFWVRYRQLEALPVGEPYVVSHLGHSVEHQDDPLDYGWPPL